jgi:hypothetical protein
LWSPCSASRVAGTITGVYHHTWLVRHFEAI